MNRLRMFGVIKVIKDETVTCSTWPKATLMRKVGFIDRATGGFYPTEGILIIIYQLNKLYINILVKIYIYPIRKFAK